MKTLRIVAIILSAIIVAFALFMFIGESMEGAKRGTSEPMTFNTILQLSFFGIGLLGLVLAWKWAITGGAISLLAFIAIFIINPKALLWPMLVFPAIAIIFIIVGYRRKKSKEESENPLKE